MTPDKAARIAANAEALYEALVAKQQADFAVYSLLTGREKEWYAASKKARTVLRRIDNDSA